MQSYFMFFFNYICAMDLFSTFLPILIFLFVLIGHICFLLKRPQLGEIRKAGAIKPTHQLFGSLPLEGMDTGSMYLVYHANKQKKHKLTYDASL